MTVLHPVAVPANLFTWQGNHGTAEHSTLFGPLREGRSFGRVYDDACDEGLTVIGTREEIVFAVNGTNSNEGEILGWELCSISRKTGRPDGRFSLLVIND